ncbi:MAG: precorrin-8X methylmutase [Deltaproteobacteria bacterium]|nr:precorrin-8X methylmutase [Deltaproteobacteria bacterium]
MRAENGGEEVVTGLLVRAIDRSGDEIEARSMEIIARELGPTTFNDQELPVVYRIIHATADFDFAENVRFHPASIKNGIKALLAGRSILVDVGMVAAGISPGIIKSLGVKVVVPIKTKECIEMAKDLGCTKAQAAMTLGVRNDVGIVVIGNAPTALLRILELVSSGQFRPDLIIGVPVGFVNAAESKEFLLKQDVPYITALGRKGGSAVAIAIVNALLRMAV